MMCVSFSRRGHPIGFFLMTSTVKSTSIEVSSPVPATSPSPWRACPSPTNNSAPGLIDRQHQLYAGVHAGVIHVAAVRPGDGREDCFLARGRYCHAAEHRLERQLENRRL